MKKTSYKYLFGPVPSRRLGISLGVDLVTHKTCSLNCIYCECGATTHLTSERNEYVPTHIVLDELDDFLSNKPHLDYITFSGSGEPTLHSRLGDVVAHLKRFHGHYRIALLTNGTLFSQKKLLDEVKEIDLIIPSLDAVSEDVFQKINRPAKELSSNDLINGLIDLRKSFTGNIWLEVFIVPGINDSESEILKFNEVIKQIKPDKVQLNTLDRPATESWVQASSLEKIKSIASKLEGNVEIIARFKSREMIDSYNIDIQESIIRILKRRPCTAQDLSSVTGLHLNEINKYIETLLNKNIIQVERLSRGNFLKIVEK